MSGDQWFQLWLAVAQVGVGSAVTVVAVFIAARLALRHQHTRTIEERSRVAAEKIAFALGESKYSLLSLYGMITFVIRPKPSSIKELQGYGIDLLEAIKQARSPLDAVSSEVGLIVNAELARGITWANNCFVDLELVVSATLVNSERYTFDELIDEIDKAANFVSWMHNCLYRYLKGQPLGPIEKPTYWRSPVKDAERFLQRRREVTQKQST